MAYFPSFLLLCQLTLSSFLILQTGSHPITTTDPSGTFLDPFAGSIGSAPVSSPPPFSGSTTSDTGTDLFGQPPTVGPAFNGPSAPPPLAGSTTTGTGTGLFGQPTVGPAVSGPSAPPPLAGSTTTTGGAGLFGQPTVGPAVSGPSAPPAVNQQQQPFGGSTQTAVSPSVSGQQQPADDSTQPPSFNGQQKQQQTVGDSFQQPAVQATTNQQQVNPVGSAQNPLGFSAQPLVDNSPFDSGSLRGAMTWNGVGSLVAMVVVGILV